MPVYRLYNHWTGRFLGPCETRQEAIKRLAMLTGRRRGVLANWMRMTHSPVEVEEKRPSKLTKTAALDSQTHLRYLRSLRELIDA